MGLVVQEERKEDTNLSCNTAFIDVELAEDVDDRLQNLARLWQLPVGQDAMIHQVLDAVLLDPGPVSPGGVQPSLE